MQTLLSIKQLQGCTVKYKKTQIKDNASTYIMSIFANKSAYYVGLVLVSSSQRNENFYFQFKFTNILSRVCFIAFFSKLTIDTVLSLKRFIRQLLCVVFLSLINQVEDIKATPKTKINM